jgi:tetratricopeptide (TPR) repeat protein
MFEARSYFDRASQRRPTEESFLNQSDLYERGRENLEALLILQEANRQFPASGPIKNNMALLYSKLNILDSALYFLQLAEAFANTEVPAEANFIGLVAKSRLPLDADSLYRLIHSENRGIQSNALALANLQERKIGINVDMSNDTILNLFSSTRLNNYILNNLGKVDSVMIDELIAISHKDINRNFSESLLFACALSLYEEGRVGKAFDILEEVTMGADNKGKYNNILAMWALEQNVPDVAIEYLRYATRQDFKEAGITSAIAHSEARHINAGILWDSVRNADIDSLSMTSVDRMVQIHSIEISSIAQLDDYGKYLFCRYRVAPFDTLQAKQLVNQINNDQLKAEAYLEKSKQLFELDQLEPAISMYQNMSGLTIDKPLYEEATVHELRMLAKKGDLRLLAQKINSKIDFEANLNDKIYFSALLNELSGDTVRASRDYNRLASRNPYDEDAIIAASRFFNTHGTKSLRSYNILAEALLENPNSVRLLKAFALEAMRNGFEQYALSAIERLQPLVPPSVMQKFFRENQTVLAPVLQ